MGLKKGEIRRTICNLAGKEINLFDCCAAQPALVVDGLRLAPLGSPPLKRKPLSAAY